VSRKKVRTYICAVRKPKNYPDASHFYKRNTLLTEIKGSGLLNIDSLVPHKSGAGRTNQRCKTSISFEFCFRFFPGHSFSNGTFILWVFVCVVSVFYLQVFHGPFIYEFCFGFLFSRAFYFPSFVLALLSAGFLFFRVFYFDQESPVSNHMRKRNKYENNIKSCIIREQH